MQKSYLLSQKKFQSLIVCLERSIPQDDITTYFGNTDINILIPANRLIATNIKIPYSEIINAKNVRQLVLTKVSSNLKAYKTPEFTDDIFLEYIELTLQAKSYFTRLANKIDTLLYISEE